MFDLVDKLIDKVEERKKEEMLKIIAKTRANLAVEIKLKKEHLAEARRKQEFSIIKHNQYDCKKIDLDGVYSPTNLLNNTGLPVLIPEWGRGICPPQPQ